MALNQRISDLPRKPEPELSDIVLIVDTGVTPVSTKQTPFANILNAFNLLSSGDLGTPGGVAVLDINGKVAINQLPAIAINDTFVVNSQAELVALVAEVGDIGVRADLNKSFILAVAPASNVNNWVELLASGIPANNILDGGNF